MEDNKSSIFGKQYLAALKQVYKSGFVELNTAPIAAEVSKEVRRLFLAEYIDNYLCICYAILYT